MRSQVGGNLRKIFLDSDVQIVPGVTRPSDLNNYCVYPVPEDEAYRLPLLQSLLEIRNENWAVIFNEENGDEHDDELEENDIITMINDVCSS